MLVAIAMVMGVGYASAAASVTLTHTGSVKGGSNEAGTTIDSEEEYYNNWGATGWAGQAFAGFSIDLPSGEYLESATLTFTSHCGGSRDDRVVEVYCIDGSNFNWDELTLVNKPGTFVGKATDKRSAEEKTMDATAMVQSILNSGSSNVVFVFGAAAAGAYLNGKSSSTPPTLTLVTTSTPKAPITIKYVDSDGNTLKGDSKSMGEVGGIPTLTDTELADFWANGMKYTYGSDDAENQQVAPDGSTVVTITFVEASKYGYTITTSYTDGDSQVQLPFEATGEYYANENVTIFFPLKQTLNGRLYSKPINNNNVSQGYLLEYNNYSANQTYTDDNVDGEVIFLKEGEEIESLTKTVDNGYCNTRFSKGYGGYVETESADIIDLGPGTYVLTARVSGATPFVFTLSDGTEILSAVSSGNYLSEVSSEAFTVAGSTTIKVAQNGNAGSTSKIPVSIDYILVRQVPQTFSYTVNADLGMTLAEGTGYEGSTVTVNLPKYIWNEQTLELKGIGGPNSDRQSFTHSFELTTNGQEEVVEYTKANLGGVVFFAEGEDIDGLTKASGFFTNGRFSKGAGGYPENTVQLCTIDAGEYIFVASTNGDFVFSTSNGDILTTVDTSNAVNEHASESFTVYSPTAITVSGTGSAGSSGKMAKAIDFIYVQESASVGVKGVKSFEAKDNAIYNLAGQEVKSASKGIFIKNGKKVVK